jgi:tRNA pseudouridine synthase 10
MAGIEFVKERPDLMILIDCLTLRVDVDIRPVFIYGRYRKLGRGIPQTRWPCRACRGRAEGCEACEGTGLQYPDSVQDLIGEPFRLALSADDTSFHGMGREDIDVRCLGRGRPFVLELKRPRIRRTDLDEIVAAVNANSAEKIEICDLRWSNRSEVSRVKETRSEKSYTIRFRIEDPPEESAIIASISSLSGVTLEQQTPKRVSHRRADKKRKRKVVSIDKISVEGDEVQFSVRCEAGTYVKELVHSDEGRTVPSVTSVLERPCEVIWLDVEDIHAD